MADTFRPDSEDGVAEVLQWAVSEKTPLEVYASGSKRRIGRPPQTEYGLDLSALGGIVLHEPEELVITAKPSTPLAEIEEVLKNAGQMLAFEPADYGPLLGEEAGKGTLAGAYAANISGPRRIQAGAARDSALGVRGVSGRGEVFKSGGKVIKNVTGYDLTKGLAGSWGTLAVLTELTFKVLPKPETSATLVLEGLSNQDAMSAMAAAMGSSCDVAGAAHLPATISGEFNTDGVSAGKAATILRLEGFGPSVDARATLLRDALTAFGAARRLDEAATSELWRKVADAAPFTENLERPLWRVSVAPTVGADIVASVAEVVPGARTFFDWQGGLVWLELPDGANAHADLIRVAVAAHGGGHALLLRADAGTRAAIDVFQPQPAPLAKLSARLKQQFDPHGILNPGRMWAGV